MIRPPKFSERAVLDALKKYNCPAPYHKIRTIFLGNIAAPVDGITPMDAVKGLWGGELPMFQNMDAVNEMLGPLLALWNQLGKHQSATATFRLSRPSITQDATGLRLLSQTRIDEIEGFADGLFAGQAEVNLPESANTALTAISDAGAIFTGIPPLLDTLSVEEADKGAAETIKNVLRLTRHIEDDMHKIVVACTKARRDFLTGMPTGKITLH